MEALANISFGLLLPIIIIELILLVVALIDLIRIEKTNGPKWAWAIAIVAVSVVGPIAYFIFGRRTH